MINKNFLSRLALFATVAVLLSGFSTPLFAEVSIPGLGQRNWDKMLLEETQKGAANNVKRLVEEAQANVNAKDESDRTPLLIAFEEMYYITNNPDRKEDNKKKEVAKYHKIAKYLIEHGADVNVQGNPNLGMGWTALYLAVSNNQHELVRLLLKKGADVNRTDKIGRTPLHIAVLNNQHELVCLLLKKGADVNKADFFEKTPLDVAKEKGRLEILKCSNKAAMTKKSKEAAKAAKKMVSKGK